MRPKEEGIELAKSLFQQQKYNCAEAVLRGVCHSQEIELPDAAKKMATPFGGGIGRSEDVCGALMGGVLTIGISLGRTRPDEDRLPSYDAAHELHASFKERFGSTSCKVLNKSDFKSLEHRVRCSKFVEEATHLTLETLRKR